jgi:hypothetical protein
MYRLLLITLFVLPSACSIAPVPQDYAAETPKLDLATYFNGKVDGWGMVQDRSGKVLRRMVVEIDCTWVGNEGTLDESFLWSDGKREKRVWKITRDGDHYTGRAADVVGVARGTAAGNALQWNYVLALPPDQGGYQMNMDDWMWMVDDKTLTNRTSMSKFGVQFAEITIFFRRR